MQNPKWIAAYAVFYTLVYHAQRGLAPEGDLPLIDLTAGLTFAAAAISGWRWLPALLVTAFANALPQLLEEQDIYLAGSQFFHVLLFGVSGCRFGLLIRENGGRFSQYTGVSLFAIGLGGSFLYAVAVQRLAGLTAPIGRDELEHLFFLSWGSNFAGLMTIAPLALWVWGYLQGFSRLSVAVLKEHVTSSTLVSLYVSSIAVVVMVAFFPTLVVEAPRILFVTLIPVTLIGLSYGLLAASTATALVGVSLVLETVIVGQSLFNEIEFQILMGVAASLSVIAGGARNDREEALRRAEVSLQAKSDFLSSMSHELRTPLNAIMGFGHMLASDPSAPLSDRQKEYAEIISKSGEDLLYLIEPVLELNKIESGHLKLQLENVAVAELLEAATAQMLPLARERGIGIANKVPGVGPPDLWADKIRLGQVLRNILSNAVKYNEDGGKIILTGEAMEPGWYRLSITDTGPGIAGDVAEKVFEPFDRLGMESGAVPGTGIGLTICKQIMDALDGRIGFDTRLGEGTTFWIELPVASAQISN